MSEGEVSARVPRPGSAPDHRSCPRSTSRLLASLVLLTSCSAPPAAPTHTPALPRILPPAPSATLPPATALWIEDEGLAPAVDLAFSPDHAVLFVKRADESVEAWDAATGTLVRRASKAERETATLPADPFSTPAPAPPTFRGANPLLLRRLDGVDDARFVAWVKTRGVRVATTADGLSLTPSENLVLEAGPDGRIVVLSLDGSVEIAHRVAPTHFTVKGWNIGFSSHYGYAGDHTTWPGDVSASFGPLPDQLALRSVAQRSINYAFGATRLYDPRRGTVIADLPEETCQPNDLVWSPLGKYLVRAECQGAMLLLTDAATGKPMPSFPGGMPVRFGADDATLASVVAGGVTVRRLGETRAAFVVPGPPMLRAVALAPGGENLATLSLDGLDVWDLATGAPLHVDATALKYGDLTRSATGRYYGFVDDGSPSGLTLVDTRTGSRRVLPGITAFHPIRDLVARVDAAGIHVEDLVTGEAEGPPVPVPEGKKGTKARARVGVQQLSFSPDGAWLVARLLDASLLVIASESHLARSTPPLDPEGCPPGPLQFVTPDTVSISCTTAVHTLSLTSGKALSPPLWKDLTAQAAEPRPAFSPPTIEAALARLRTSYGGLPWSATPSLLVARLDPPLLARARDGRFVSLHAFGHGAGRAAIVVDDAGRWDANALGETLVHVSISGTEDAAEKARRKVPGLLAAFVRGD